MEIKFYLWWVIKLKYSIEIDVYSSRTTANKILNERFINSELRRIFGPVSQSIRLQIGLVTWRILPITVRESQSETCIFCKQGNKGFYCIARLKLAIWLVNPRSVQSRMDLKFSNHGCFTMKLLLTNCSFHTGNIRTLVFCTDLISFGPYVKTSVRIFCRMDLTIG